MQPYRYLTPRGFTTYDEFEDTNGSRVTVRESSAAEVLREPERDGALVGQIEGPFVWIFISPAPAANVSAHLSLGQAKRLREALDTFIREAEADQT